MEMIPIKLTSKKIIVCFSISFALFIAIILYSVLRMNALSSRIEALDTELNSLTKTFASTTQQLHQAIVDTHTVLSTALTTQQQNVGTIQQQLGNFQNQVGTISGTLTNLQKLSKTDPELLKKYSKVYFLNENYVPARLSEIPTTYEYSTRKQLLLQTDVLPRMEAMLNDASSSKIALYAFSAYRSFAEQRALKSEYRITYGAGTANSFSADQGYSEHQLGTALDFITSGLGGVLDGFDSTAAYQWMQTNAYKYGFILSYPKDNGYYVYEPWHWRFVGVKLATDLHNQGKNFYDMDQRDIDTYLINIFD